MEPGPNKKSWHQKRMGPAPFASFEDLSDETVSPEEKEINVIRLPGISEDLTPSPDVETRRHPGISLVSQLTVRESTSPSTSPNSMHQCGSKMKLGNTPRIDISRASSSSHYDSRDSSPEREIIFESSDPNSTKLGLGFKEDDALELRLSTEELDFHDVAETKTHIYKHRSASPEFDELCINNNYTSNNRKDSQCSDVILLSISGRTSRLSSIGSQGSGQSRLSNASHISVTSGHSAYSQCSSPHKTLLETSFCGFKSSQTNIMTDFSDPKGDTDLEKAILSRNHNSTEAIVAEGLVRKAPPIKIESATPLKQKSTENKLDDKPKLPRRIVSKSGVEYIYIPLKGPLPADDSVEKSALEVSRREPRPSSSSSSSHNKPRRKAERSSSRTPAKATEKKTEHTRRPTPDTLDRIQTVTEPKYIRIRLKPDHCYEDYDPSKETKITKTSNLSLSLHSPTVGHADNSFHVIQHHARSLTNSPKLLRKEPGGISPSQSLPRRNSFATLFRSGSDVSSSSKTKRKTTFTGCIEVRHRKNTSACVSSNESVDSKGKQKSVLSLFKFSNKDKSKSAEATPEKINRTPAKPRPTRQEKPDKPLQSESIRIPLHSPNYYEEKSLLQEVQTSSQDSQVTVVEVEPPHKPKIDMVPVSEETIQIVEAISVEISKKTDLAAKEKEVVEQNNEQPKNDVATTVITVEVEATQSDKDILNFPRELSGLSPKEEIDVKNLSLDLTDSLKNVEAQSVGSFEGHNSSESERDMEIEKEYRKCDKPLLSTNESVESERKAVISQQNSFEDELPYVPTTLPQERSAALPILPIRQRSALDMSTCSIERPRSTTPIHSSGLDSFVDSFEVKFEPTASVVTTCPEKLKISLPRAESCKAKCQSEEVLRELKRGKLRNEKTIDVPPPLPAKGIQKSWINFEEVPERRKPPKRIQTIPSRGQIDITGLVKDNIVYTYVNPEECKCECHEHKEGDAKVIQKDEELLSTEKNGAHVAR
ncbi:uncharacterized protein LOC126750646 isoform X2 [Anthonomus grandis grandis]|uniref:uncharacterized protein LOC126750646 isoform X2 n=1 Tax=Anthonomus grandis grandis TaxID=2921223 RepID=UPI002165B2AE|nr:uncharacterized protein LOC126750646 isoform X2 [Anthonomus grandis grandis]